MGTIWVHAETKDGQVSSITLELLAKARELGDVVAVHAGSDAEAAAAELGAHGASRVLTAGDLDGGLIGPALASALAAVIESESPSAILFGTTYGGRDVAGRLSVKLNAPVITNVVDLIDEGGLTGVEPVFGGTTNVKTKFTGDTPGIFLVRPKSFTAESTGGGPAEVTAIPVPDLGNAGAAKITNQFVEESDGPKLDEAAIVVSGGRGLGEAEKYHLVEDLASKLGGAAGASRAIVDAGWVPYSYQVGQTGKVVKPDVYIAAGISGATQHMVGMKGSKTIIAINKDPEAPIFSVADLGIIGDVHKVLPALLEALDAK